MTPLLNAGLMLGQRRRRRLHIKPAFNKRFVLTVNSQIRQCDIDV